MAYAFKHPSKQFDSFYKDPEDDQVGPRGRDANVIAAAQWILWSGQTVRRHALYKGPPEGSTLSAPTFFNLERAGTSPEKWELWKEGFRSASEEGSASEECRNVALRAFTLMDALEKNMPS